MKRSFKLAEVCKQLDLPPYVLRYWETEFPALQSSTNRANGPGRAYSVEEVGILRRIKQLLYEEGYTIAGAKKKLESDAKTAQAVKAAGSMMAEVSLLATARPAATPASTDHFSAPSLTRRPSAIANASEKQANRDSWMYIRE